MPIEKRHIRPKLPFSALPAVKQLSSAQNCASPLFYRGIPTDTPKAPAYPFRKPISGSAPAVLWEYGPRLQMRF